MKQKISVKALIKKDEKLLLLRRVGGNPKYTGQFEILGGNVEFGEDPLSALKRQIIQEIGIQPTVVQLWRVVSWLDKEEQNTQHIIIVYLASLDGQSKIFLGKEHDKYVWEKLSDIQLENLNVLTKAVLADEVKDIVSEKEESNLEPNDVLETSFEVGKEVIVYTDGGSRGNPGPSASGFVIFTMGGDLIFEGGKYLGITTNNQAEYQAVKLGLEKALEIGARLVDLKLDSQLVANQMTGIYQIKNRDLWPIYASIKELIKQFEKVSFTHVRREFNKDADAMVNKILDQHQ